MRVCVIGAGASGLMSAGFISKYGHEVVVFDSNEKSGKKIYITGKGRCNFTNVCDIDEFLTNVVRGGKFLFSALHRFSSYDTLAFFEDNGMKSVVERGNRAFPQSNKASDVTKALMKHCENVEFRYNSQIREIRPLDGKYEVSTSRKKEIFDAVIIATGGKSYEATGSTGDGYVFARKLGHKIVELKSALVPIALKDKFVKSLQGLSLKNVALVTETETKTYREFGEMMFTDIGITGPIVLTTSSLINRDKVKKLYIDLKPALTDEQLDKRILREFESEKNKNIANVMKTLLPSSLINVFLSKIGLDLEKKVNSITFEERKRLVSCLKCFTLNFDSLYNLSVGIVTSGGVDLNEINPKTMESKLHKNLFFIGEVLDIDALTGGFNLQIAFSTAVACAESFKERE